jgi:hypothetical protein
MRTRLSWTVICCAAVLLLACGDDDGKPSTPPDSDNAGSGPGKDAGNEHDAGGGGPMRPELERSWTKIEPGGDTICARGDEFHFFVRGGTVNKLAIVFDGGGACWNAETCGIADAIFDPKADPELPDPGDGIGNNEDEENPFRDWYQVFIPYCTGDVHWGDNDMTYPGQNGMPDVTIHHKGQVNTKAVLDWVYERFEKPDTIFVTGMSAGSYGSIGWAPHIMDHYKDSHVVQLGDSGAGVITDTFFEDSFPSWKADSILPKDVPGLDKPIAELKLEDLYISLSNAYPTNVFSQYNTNNDENQRFYYTAMGGKDEDWSPKMHAKISTIIAGAPKFRSFIEGGIKHVVLVYPEFYTYASDGTRIRDWVADLADGKAVENVECKDCAEAETVDR